MTPYTCPVCGWMGGGWTHGVIDLAYHLSLSHDHHEFRLGASPAARGERQVLLKALHDQGQLKAHLEAAELIRLVTGGKG